MKIKDGAHVVLKKGTKMKVLQICKQKKVTFDKKTFSIAAAIGQPFGASWEVKGNDIVAVQDTESEALDNAKSAADNRDITENTDSQKLQHDDITSLKEQGVSGESIIEQLVDNSSTFESKTTFSQEKYLRKKKDKYLTRFTICEPSMRLVSELYWRKTPSPKIIHLRPDTLAQMLACTNVRSGSKVMVVENCQGLLVAAVQERLAGSGSVVHLHTEDIPCTVAEENFDFPPTYQDIIMRMQLSYFNKVVENEDTANIAHPLEITTNGDNIDENVSENTAADSTNAQNEPTTDTPGEAPSQTNDDPVITATDVASTVKEPSSEGVTPMETEGQPVACIREDAAHRKKRKYPQDLERVQRRQKREELNQKISKLLNEREMDALLVASRFHPAPIVSQLINYLAPSRPFVVYCSAKEPLVECFTQLKERGCVLNMQLTETWLREYQVLENRTHPLVNMSGTGGFLLTGTKVVLE